MQTLFKTSCYIALIVFVALAGFHVSAWKYLPLYIVVGFVMKPLIDLMAKRFFG